MKGLPRTAGRYPRPAWFVRARSVVLAAVGVPLLWLAAGCRPAEPPKPNVLVIVIDTLRADHLSAYGYARPTSPRIDELASQGLLFRNAYSQAPWTTPSVASLLTSQYPSVLGIREEPNTVGDEFVLLSEVLQRQGYGTGAVVSHYFLAKKWNFDQGFDWFNEENVFGHEGISSPGITDAALSFLDEYGDEPFFLFAHYFDPHYDYIEHEGFRFSDELDYQGSVTSGMGYAQLMERLPELDEADLDYIRSLYDSEIAFTDHHIGRLLDALREKGIFDNTLIVLTADHGEEFMERKTIGHGGSLYNELTHVPLVLKYPSMSPETGAGTQLDTAVGLIDVYPTILDALGVPVEHRISGRSLLGVAPADEPPPRPVYSETDWGFYRSVVASGDKMIHRITSGEHFFYDLEVDPDEKDNLTAKLAQSGKLQDFNGHLDLLYAWMAFLEAQAGKAQDTDISEEDRAKLKALGYFNQ